MMPPIMQAVAIVLVAGWYSRDSLLALLPKDIVETILDTAAAQHRCGPQPRGLQKRGCSSQQQDLLPTPTRARALASGSACDSFTTASARRGGPAAPPRAQPLVLRG